MAGSPQHAMHMEKLVDSHGIRNFYCLLQIRREPPATFHAPLGYNSLRNGEIAKQARGGKDQSMLPCTQVRLSEQGRTCAGQTAKAQKCELFGQQPMVASLQCQLRHGNNSNHVYEHAPSTCAASSPLCTLHRQLTCVYPTCVTPARCLFHRPG
jgi:hypothetical protein